MLCGVPGVMQLTSSRACTEPRSPDFPEGILPLYHGPVHLLSCVVRKSHIADTFMELKQYTIIYEEIDH